MTSNTRPRDRAALPRWRQLTPGQRAMLERLRGDGPLVTITRWEMRTVRSLLAKGLLRPRSRTRDGDAPRGLWFVTAKAIALMSAVVREGTSAADRRGDAAVSGQTSAPHAP